MQLKSGVRSFEFFVVAGMAVLCAHSVSYHILTGMFGWWRICAITVNFVLAGVVGYHIGKRNNNRFLGVLFATLAPAMIVSLKYSVEVIEQKTGTSGWTLGAIVLASVSISLLVFYVLTLATNTSLHTALWVSLGVLVCQVLGARALPRERPVSSYCEE